LHCIGTGAGNEKFKNEMQQDLAKLVDKLAL